MAERHVFITFAISIVNASEAFQASPAFPAVAAQERGPLQKNRIQRQPTPKLQPKPVKGQHEPKKYKHKSKKDNGKSRKDKQEPTEDKHEPKTEENRRSPCVSGQPLSNL